MTSHIRTLLGLVALASLSCSRGPALHAPGASDQPPTPPPQTVQRPAEHVAPAEPAKAAKLEFIQDDFPRALELARREGRALVVDAWAPWCHTCLSMKHFVFTDSSLTPLTKRAVFVALDTDRPENGRFVEQFPIEVWPTFFVIDGRSERVVGLWPGAASAAEFRNFVEHSVRAIEALHRDEINENSPLGKLLDANVAELARDYAHAAELYGEAVRLAPNDWERRSEALLGWISALREARRVNECVKVGGTYADQVHGAARPIDFVRNYHSCAKQLKNAAERRKIEQAALARVSALCDAPAPDTSVDDRADALDLLAELLANTGNTEGERRARVRRLTLLEEAAARAPSPAAASTFDYARAETYLALGQTDDALRMLAEREKQLPDSYEPPARMASLLHRLGRDNEAKVAIERALARAYGPRKLRYLSLKAAIVGALGDTDAQIRTLEAEVAGYEGLQLESYAEALNDARRRLLEARQRRSAK